MIPPKFKHFFWLAFRCQSLLTWEEVRMGNWIIVLMGCGRIGGYYTQYVLLAYVSTPSLIRVLSEIQSWVIFQFYRNSSKLSDFDQGFVFEIRNKSVQLWFRDYQGIFLGSVKSLRHNFLFLSRSKIYPTTFFYLNSHNSFLLKI